MKHRIVRRWLLPLAVLLITAMLIFLLMLTRSSEFMSPADLRPMDTGAAPPPPAGMDFVPPQRGAPQSTVGAGTRREETPIVPTDRP